MGNPTSNTNVKTDLNVSQFRDKAAARVIQDAHRDKANAINNLTAFVATLPTTPGVSQQALAAATAGLASTASPALTGNPTAPTPAVNDSSPAIATTAWVAGQVATNADGVPVAVGTAAAGASKKVAAADHSHALGPLTYVQNMLQANVALTLANTFYDGPAVSLGAGTWLLMGSVYLTNGTYSLQAQLWDGNQQVIASAETNTGKESLFLGGVVVLEATTTMKISAAASGTGGAINNTLSDNPVGKNASYLVALKIG